MDKDNNFKNPVFIVSAAVIFLLVLIGGFASDQFGAAAEAALVWITTNFGWFFLLAVFIIILFLIAVSVSKYGGIRLGADSDRPEFPFFTWIGMLFSAGFGAGLVFWGIAEPMSHFFTSPYPDGDTLNAPAARLAMAYSFFHWGISQWSVFAIVGLVIGFLQFRKKRNGLVSTALEPVTGNRPIVRNTIDSLAVIATVMGVATSLGLGVLQMAGGLDVGFGIDNSFTVQLAVIGAMFIGYTLSATTGLEKGIAYLSNLNLGLALLLMVFVFFTGPTVFILETFVLALGDYLTNFIQYSLRLTPYQGGTWVRDWTVFYWAWAIAWSPFVGAFVARVSRGRTIREFVFGVLIVPPAIACLWIAVFGGTAIWYDLNFSAGIAEAVDADLTAALFLTFQELPLDTLMSGLAILLIFTFLVTSADSATYILASMTTYGSLNPSVVFKVVWGVLMAGIAAVLLRAGGLEALQTASLISALPFTLILLLMLVAMAKLLRHEPLPIRKADLRRFRRLEKEANKQSE
ncbi:BCCT family transporter [Indiicoccus explosivorum]|uniref:BCCT family transporter n=1 Tax=Indiicoccus explosivorum TaxID=1917864 RepID=UPI000B4307CA|nr:BCCT family transporter [Indiicoccus explosivorum]